MSAVISPVGNANMVHESEAQRQHARLKLPAKVRFQGQQGGVQEVELIDLSAGGFSFEQGSQSVVEGKLYRGKLMFKVEGIGFAMDVEFQVRSIIGGKRVGCEFHNLRPREMSALRYIISSFIGGELVNVGGLISILQRENFTKARGSKGNERLSLLGRLRAMSLTLVILVAGLSAFAYVLYQFYDIYFVTHADSAQVSVPGTQVAMPREGTVQSLVTVGSTVSKGAPVATFTANMLDALKGALPESEMTPDNLERLFNKRFQGTLTSPCDCKVVSQLVGDGQVAPKGTPVFMLAPVDSVATVEARFPYRAFNKLQPGTPLTFLVGGETTERGGRIASIALQDGGLASDIRVHIQPDEPLASDLAKRPVDVRIRPLNGFFANNGLNSLVFEK